MNSNKDNFLIIGRLSDLIEDKLESIDANKKQNYLLRLLLRGVIFLFIFIPLYIFDWICAGLGSLIYLIATLVTWGEIKNYSRVRRNRYIAILVSKTLRVIMYILSN